MEKLIIFAVAFSPPICRNCVESELCDVTIWKDDANAQWISIDDESKAHCDRGWYKNILEMHCWWRCPKTV